VVARWPHGAEPSLGLARHQCASHLTCATSGVKRGAVRALADPRVRVNRATAGDCQLTDVTDVRRAVDQLDLGLARRRRRHRPPPEPIKVSQMTLDRFKASRYLERPRDSLERVVRQARPIAEVEPRPHSGRGSSLGYGRHGSRYVPSASTWMPWISVANAETARRAPGWRSDNGSDHCVARRTARRT
jgi:hypothetical protein